MPGPGAADLYSRETQPVSPTLDGQTVDLPRSGVRQSPARAWRAEQALATLAERENRADLRARLRDRRRPALLVTRPHQGDETVPAPGGGAQSGADPAETVR